MVNKCCVPNCTSNYDSKKEAGLVICFIFPSKEELKKKWIRKIPRGNLIISKHTVVCVKHFKEEDIIRNEILPEKNGDPDIVIPHKRIKLKADAVLFLLKSKFCNGKLAHSCVYGWLFASKVMNKLNCTNYKKFFSPGKNVINAEIDSSLKEYFNNLYRGGLSSILLHTFQASYSIFNTCISRNLEEKFLNLKNQKAVLLDLNNNFWKFSNCLQINSMCSNPTCGKLQSFI